MMISPSGKPCSASSNASALAGHGDQVLDGVLVQQHRRGFVPAEWRPGHTAALLAHDSVETQLHLVGTLSRDQQNPTLALDDVF
jgi:hypothetical protein